VLVAADGGKDLHFAGGTSVNLTFNFIVYKMKCLYLSCITSGYS
jgi:hypothetical protein